MWRTRAILILLFEEIGSLPKAEPEALERARRRTIAVIALDWIAILVLVLWKPDGLALTPGEETLFTLGMLAVAAHSGFRLGHLQKLRQIERLAEELEARDGD